MDSGLEFTRFRMVPAQEIRKVTGRESRSNSGCRISRRDEQPRDMASRIRRRAMTRDQDFMETINDVLSAAWDAFQAGDLVRAERLYRTIVQHSPAVAHAWYMLGAVEQVQGRLVEAVVNYQEAIRWLPEFPEACNNLGVASMRWAGATRPSPRSGALALKPDYAEAHNNLGNAYHERGVLGEAETNYRRAVQLRPDYIEALNNLGNVLRIQGRMAEALECYDQAAGSPAGPCRRAPEPGDGLARAGRVRAGMARVRVAAEVPAIRDTAIPPAALGR